MNAATLAMGFLRDHGRLVLIGLVLALTSTVSFRTLFYTAAQEVVYDGRLALSYCTRSGICIGRFELDIGNTGSASQPLLRASIQIDPAKWSAGHEIRNIAADQARNNDPEISQTRTDDGYVYTLSNFDAGTEFLLTLQCLRCSPTDLEKAKSAGVEVQAAGDVLQGDPRATTLARRLSHLL